MRTIKAVVLTIALIGAGADTLIAKDKSADQESSVAAGPQMALPTFTSRPAIWIVLLRV